MSLVWRVWVGFDLEGFGWVVLRGVLSGLC